MAEFLIKAADERGRMLEQVENGYSEAEVRDRFVQQGFLVYWVKPRGVLSGDFSLRRRGKVKPTAFLIFNQQFLTLIKAGLPILNSLDLLIRRQKDKYLQNLLQNVRDRVKGGESLSDAFVAQGVFPKIYTTTLMAGEKSGNMEEVLSRYIAFQRLALTFKKKLAVSLVYPTLLVTVVFGMLIFLVLCGATVCEAVPGHERDVASGYVDDAANRNPRSAICSNCSDCSGRRRARPVAVEKDRQRRGDCGSGDFEAPAPRGYLAEVPGCQFFSDAFDSTRWGHAAGTLIRDGGCVHEQPAHLKRRHRGSCPGAGRTTSRQEPGGAEDVSGLVGRDD